MKKRKGKCKKCGVSAHLLLSTRHSPALAEYGQHSRPWAIIQTGPRAGLFRSAVRTELLAHAPPDYLSALYLLCHTTHITHARTGTRTGRRHILRRVDLKISHPATLRIDKATLTGSGSTGPYLRILLRRRSHFRVSCTLR